MLGTRSEPGTGRIHWESPTSLPPDENRPVFWMKSMEQYQSRKRRPGNPGNLITQSNSIVSPGPILPPSNIETFFNSLPTSTSSSILRISFHFFSKQCSRTAAPTYLSFCSFLSSFLTKTFPFSSSPGFTIPSTTVSTLNETKIFPTATHLKLSFSDSQRNY